MVRKTICFILMAVFVFFIRNEAFSQEFVWKTHLEGQEYNGSSRQILSIIFPGMEKTTNGKLKFKLSWFPVSLNSDKIIQSFRVDQLQCISLKSSSTTKLCPEMMSVQLPFLFNNEEEIDYLRQSMMPDFDGFFEKQNLVLLAWLGEGFSPIFSSKSGFREIKDFQGAKFLNTCGWVEEKFLHTLKAENCNLDVMQYLGKIGEENYPDSIIFSLYDMVSLQLYEQMKFSNTMPLYYPPVILLVKSETFQTLPGTYGKALLDARLPLMDKANADYRAQNKKIIKALEKYGLEIFRASHDQIMELRKKSMPVYEAAIGKYFSKELFDEIQGNLAEFREKQKSMKGNKIIRVCPETGGS